MKYTLYKKTVDILQMYSRCICDDHCQFYIHLILLGIVQIINYSSFNDLFISNYPNTQLEILITILEIIVYHIFIITILNSNDSSITLAILKYQNRRYEVINRKLKLRLRIHCSLSLDLYPWCQRSRCTAKSLR